MSELSSARGSKTLLMSGSSSPSLARILLNCETAKRVSPSPAFIHCTRVAERAVRCKTLISFLSSCSFSISASTALILGGKNPPLHISSSDVSAFDCRRGSLRQALLLRLEFFAQQLFCPVQPPFYCRQRQAQEIRDPLQRHLVIKTQLQDQPMVFIERVNGGPHPGLFKRVARRERSRERFAMLDQRLVQIDPLAALPPRTLAHPQRHAPDDGVKPRGELRRLFNRGQRLESQQQRFLHGVFGRLIAGYRLRHPIGGGAVTQGQRVERTQVAQYRRNRQHFVGQIFRSRLGHARHSGRVLHSAYI